MTLRAALLAKLARMPFPRAFPVTCALTEVSRSAQFWQRVGFERFLALPPGEPQYIGLRRGTSEIALMAWDWAEQRYGLKVPAGCAVRDAWLC